jgi:transcriptional accessory protein Tex/SPT6
MFKRLHSGSSGGSGREGGQEIFNFKEYTEVIQRISDILMENGSKDESILKSTRNVHSNRSIVVKKLQNGVSSSLVPANIYKNGKIE